MLKFTSLVILLFSFNTFASTNGGGVLMKHFSMPSNQQFEISLNGVAGGHVGPRPTPEIVFHMGQKNGLINFAYGHLEGSQWKIQKIQLPTWDLESNSTVIEALEQSELTNNWIQIK